MKRIVSLVLSFFMTISIITGMDVSVFATSETTEAEIIDIDIYKSQCITGIAFDPNSDAVEKCNGLYNYYINDDVFSPTQTFLDEAYANDELMAEFALWQTYSLGADSSTVVNVPVQRKDYYESLIMAIISQTLNDNSQNTNDLYVKATGYASTMVDGLRNISQATNNLELLDKFPDVNSAETKAAFNSLFENNPKLGTCDVIDIILGLSTNVLDAIDRIAAYNTMVSLDNYTKQWIDSMYNACDDSTDIALKDALLNLKNSSSSFTEAVLVDIKDTSFRLANWSVSATINTKLSLMASTNPLTTALLAGLKLGKSISDICFSASDVFEQFFMLECVYDIQSLSRTVTKNRENTFLESQTKENSLAFNYAVDFYYESIINTDIDCMIDFLDTLYNGGILKGAITWMYGVTDDYQEAVNALESLRNARSNNYDSMITNYLCALKINYSDTYDYYFSEDNTIPITDISFMTSRILPPPYPAGYANMIVGDFANIDVQYVPSNTTQKVYAVSSDNPSVVEVNDNVMTAVSVGTANITVTSVDNPDVSYTAEIKVGEKLEDTENTEIITRFTYTVNNSGEATITGLVDGYEPTNLNIPKMINGYAVKKIDGYAFDNCNSLVSVKIPDSVISIGDDAFCYCDSLTEIEIPDSVTSIGDYAFYNTAYYNDSSNWEDCVLYIGNHLIEASDFISGEYEIKPGTKTIADAAFRYCENLISITIPESITNISDDVFYGCDSLTSITVSSANANYSSVDGVLFNKTKTELIQYPAGKNDISYTIAENVTRIGDFAFCYCRSLQKLYWNAKSVEDLDGEADVFYKAGTTVPGIELVFGDTVESIPAFLCNSSVSNSDYTKNIKSVTIGDNVTSIGTYAFSDCKYLTSVTIGEGVTRIGGGAFNNCTSLTTITIPDSVTSIAHTTFSDCTSLTSIEIPDSITSIGEKAFYNTGYYNEESNWENDVLYIGNHLIEAKDIISGAYEIKAGTKTVADYAFYSCSNLASITIPNSVTSIGDVVFENCFSLTSIIIPDSVTSIGSRAFSSCDSLTTITIPDSVTSIGTYAFSSFNLISVYITDIAAWCGIDFGDSDSNPLRYADNLYLNGELVTDVVIPDGVSRIPTYAFSCDGITSVTIPDSVTSIDDYAFSNCDCLTSVTIPDSVTSIGIYAFGYCNSLTSVIIGNGIKNIEDNVFEGCSVIENVILGDGLKYIPSTLINKKALKSFVIGNNISIIESFAFEDCIKLTSITIPDSVTRIGEKAFYDCRSLTSVYITDTGAWCNIDFESASSNPLWYADNLYLNGELVTDVVVPDGVSQIPAYAFSCDSLTSVTISDSVTSIGVCAFYNCESLTTITIPDSVTSIGEGAFTYCDNLDSVYISDIATWCSSIGFGSWSSNPLRYADNLYLNGELVTDVVIPDGVSRIPTYAFSCDSLTTITIPDSVTSIGEYAFLNCDNLTSVYITDVVAWCDIDFGNSVSNPLCNATNLYLNGELVTDVVIPDGVSRIAAYAFLGCEKLKAITIPDSVTSIGDGAFRSCDSLTSIIIPDSVTSIGEYAFYNCTSLSDVFYSGIQEQWSNVKIDGNNFYLSEARIHYNTDISNLGNHYGEPVVTTVPTCTSTGSQTYTCPCGYEKVETLEALGHNYSEDWTVETEATCTQSGLKHKECIECGEVLEEIEIPVIDHILSDWIIDCEPDCEYNGYKYRECIECGEIIEETEIPAYGHISSDWIIDCEPDCEYDGYKYRECIECGEIIEETEILANGHISSDWIIEYEPTCEDDGYMYKECTECGEIVEEREIIATGHVASYWIIESEPTCESDGYKYKECTECGAFFEEVVTHATGHSESDWIIADEPTCVDEGYKIKECTECGEIIKASGIPAKGHKVVKDPAVNETCTKEGKTEGIHCSVCDVVIKAQITVAAKGHIASKWIVTKKATVNAPGSKYQKCTECGSKLKTAKIAQLKCTTPKLKSVVNNATGVQISWNKVTGADNFEVYRKTGSGKWTKIVSVKGSETSYTDKTAKSGTSYKYTVKAKNEAGLSGYNTTGLTIKCIADPVLKAPTSTKKGITLKWNKITGAQGYIVFRKAGNGSFKKLTAVKGVSKISYIDKKAKKGVTYTYKIKAYSGKTYSAYSNAKIIKDKY